MAATELGDLGQMRHACESSSRSLMVTYARGLFPMAVAPVLVAIGLKFFAPSDWQSIALFTLAALMFANGVRVLVRTWRRRWQKVAIYDRGFAVWRNNVLTPYHWDKVETINASVARAEGAASSFLGFEVICRGDDENRETLRFDLAGDSLDNLQGLWRQMEETWAQHRIPAALAKVNCGEEIMFGRQVWSKYVAAQIGVSRMGLHCTPRGQKTRFIDWLHINAVRRHNGRIIVTGKDSKYPVIDARDEDLPGYLTLLAAAELAQKTYVELFERLNAERIPAARAQLEQGQELRFGRFGISLNALRYEAEATPWESIVSTKPEVDYLAVLELGKDEPKRLLFGAIDLADRLVLLFAVDHALKRVEEAESETQEELN